MMQNSMPQRKLFNGEANGNGNRNRVAFEGRELLDGPFSRDVLVRGERLAHTEMGSSYFKEGWKTTDSLAHVNGEMVLVAISRGEIWNSALLGAKLCFLALDPEDGLLVASAAHERIEGRQFYALVPKEKAAQLARTSLPEQVRNGR